MAYCYDTNTGGKVTREIWRISIYEELVYIEIWGSGNTKKGKVSTK